MEQSYIDPATPYAVLKKAAVRTKGTDAGRFVKELDAVAARGWRAADPQADFARAPEFPAECGQPAGRIACDYPDGAMRFGTDEAMDIVHRPAYQDESFWMPENQVAQARIAWFVGSCTRADLPKTRISGSPLFMAMAAQGFGWCQAPEPDAAGYALRTVALKNVLLRIPNTDASTAGDIASLYGRAIVEDGLGGLQDMGDVAEPIPAATAALRSAFVRANLANHVGDIAARVWDEVRVARVYKEPYEMPPSGYLHDLGVFYAKRAGNARALFDICMLAIAAILHLRSVGVVALRDSGYRMGWRRILALEQVGGTSIALSSCCAVSIATGKEPLPQSALIPHYGVLPSLWDWRHCIFAADPPAEQGAPESPEYMRRREYAEAIHAVRHFAATSDPERNRLFETGFCDADGGMRPIGGNEPLAIGTEMWLPPRPVTEVEAFERTISSFARGLRAIGYKHASDDELLGMLRNGGADRFVDLRSSGQLGYSQLA